MNRFNISDLFKDCIAFLNQAFPEDPSWRDYLRTITLVSVFIAGFLYHFQPSNIGYLHWDQWIVCSIFGLITFVVCILYRVGMELLGIQSQSKDWVFWKWMISTLLLIVLIGVANFLFIAICIDQNFQISFLLNTIGSTLVLGLFPLLFIATIRVNRNKLRYQKISASLSTKEAPVGMDIQLHASNGELQLEINSSQVLYAESQQNYIFIYYLINDHLQKIKIRNTLSSIVCQMNAPNIIRCHRSYIVNLHKLTQVTGNAQGLKLHFEHTDDYVPVSRRYISAVQAFLGTQSK